MNINEYKSKVQAEAEKAHIEHNCRSTCCMSVGLGKAKLAINRIEANFKKKFRPRTIFTTAREIYIKNFQIEMDKFCLDSQYLKEQLTFCCNKSLSKYEEEWWDVVIVDESHKEIDAYLDFLKKIIIINPNVEIICLSGTPKTGRDYDELYSIVPISYEKRVDSAVEEGLLNDYRIHIFNYNLSGSKLITYKYLKNKYDQYLNTRQSNSFGFEMQKLKQFLGNSESKIELGKYLLQNKLDEKKVLVYAGSIKQSECLEIPSFHSKLKKEQKELIYDEFYNDNFLHLANVGGLKESVSIPNLTHGLFLNIDASYTSMEQAIGRFCRLSVEQKSHVIILCCENTIEKDWLEKALHRLDVSKIKNYRFEEWYELAKRS